MNHIDYNLSFTKREFQLLRLVLWVAVATLALLERLGLLRDGELVSFATNLHNNLRDDDIKPEERQFHDTIEAFDKLRDKLSRFAAAPVVANALRPISGRMVNRSPNLSSIPRAAIKPEFVVMFSFLTGNRPSASGGVCGKVFDSPQQALAALHAQPWWHDSMYKRLYYIAQRIPQAAGYTYRKVENISLIADSDVEVAAPTPKAEPVTYKVQYESARGSGRWYDYIPTDKSRPSNGLPMAGVTRNAAYRAMRDRLSSDKSANWLPHRVVPSTTPEGVDKSGRGWYQVEFWSRINQKYQPCAGNVGFSPGRNQYATAEAAQAAIDKYGCEGDSYRVKWHADEK